MSQLDYGIIGNCQASALISRTGTVSWCCLPRFDAPSMFASILDEDNGGFWSIEPAASPTGQTWETRQHYLVNTNVLATCYTGSQGDSFEIIDFMPRFEQQDRMQKPPQIIRVLRLLSGMPRVVVRCRPRFDYGKTAPRVSQSSSEIVFQTDADQAFLTSDASISYILSETPFELKEDKHFVFSYGQPFQGPIKFIVEEQLERTISFWRIWAKHCNIPFEFQNEVIRSALALKLHIFEDTGAIIAATTTSLPEGPDGNGRCWDYRYCWLRDAYFVVTALNRMGQFEEMEQFIRYLQNIGASEPSKILQPVYGIDGQKELVEDELTWLKGFRGFGPVRVGNAAYRMEQHDVYGEMVLAITPTFFDRRIDRTDQEQALRNVQQLIEQAIISFEQPDAGLWEFRGTKKHSVFSKLMNWAAVDRGVRIARHIGRHDLVAEWNPICERMRQNIEQNGWNDIVGYYAQSYGGDSPDASNLLLPAYNFISHRDVRFQKTIDAYERMLRFGQGVYRYRTPDDFGVPTTTFTVCAFWMADALWGVGRKTEARELFASVLNKSNHLGLLSEDMDPETGELWGNFPQTYSHVGLINTAMRISKSWDDAF
ncbi:MAG: glycoside hydrolase family 15 protein [Oligoflexia bacterium]|nr:glycoside hydrolase family 15 protein [Oligoflexia bacterium]